MWLSINHGCFFISHRITAVNSVHKIHQVIQVSWRSLIFALWLAGAGFAPASAGAQIPSAFPRPAAADFDQTIGMPPYVFRTYQFAAAAPGKVRVEVFIGMVNDILQFVKIAAAGPDSAANALNENRGYRAQYEVNITVWDKEKNPLDSRNWKRELLVNSFAETNDRKKLNREHAAFDLPPGEYEVALEITDRDTGKNLRERRPLKLTLPAENQLQFSSLVFMKPAPAATPRDSLLQNFAALTMSLPVTARLPGEAATPEARDFSGAAAYFEIYGAPLGENLQLQYQLLDWRRQVQAEWQQTLQVAETPVRQVADFAGKIKQAGLHTFNIVVKRGANGKAKDVTVEGSFQVQISAEQNYATSMPGDKTLLYEPLRYIVKSAEYKRLAETGEAARDSLVAAFWRQRDPNPATAGNQLQEEFYRRVAFADTRFAAADSERSGWESDRGRIYIKYGPPREVHHQFAEQGAAPYEIWLYPDLDLSFIFRDKSGSGDFELVNR